MVISNAKVTVLAAALAATGAVLNSTDMPVSAAILCMVACQLALWRVFKVKILVALLLGSIPLLFFVYAQIRSQPPLHDLSGFAERDVIFTASADQTSCTLEKKEWVLKCHQLLFPQVQKLAGETLLIRPHHTDEATASLHEDQTTTTLATSDSGRQQLPPQEKSTKNGPRRQVELLIHGHIRVPAKPVPAWDYNRSKKLAADGIFSLCTPDRRAADGGVTVIGSSHASNSALDIFASRYEDAMNTARAMIVNTHRQHLPPKLADLLSSMVLGNRAVALSAETTDQFRNVGLSHILAASGFNLTIVAVMTFAISRLLTPSVILRNNLCFLTMFGFVSLAGPSPSVVRAALMCSILLLAKTGQRRSQVIAALAASFLLTVVADPLCTGDLGLQLSYAATVGIVLASEPLSRHFYGGLIKWKRALADAVSVVLIAQLSVMPIQLYFFWKAGTMFIPANLLVTPLVTPLTMIGFASSTLALLSPAQTGPPSFIIAFADAIAFIPMTAMILLVNAFGSVNGANFSIGPPSTISIVVYYGNFLLLILSLRMQRKIMWAQLAFAGSLVWLLWRAPPPLMTLANVHGHTVLINAKNEAVVFDQNDNPGHPSGKIIERFLNYCGARLCSDSFQVGTLNSGWRFVHSRNWLLVSLTADQHISTRAAVMEVLSEARKMQCNKLIISTPRAINPHSFLPGCEFITTPQAANTDLRLIEWRQRIIEFSRK
ncbi:MAG TPA: ComEC/Rec2 family competence protein [Drouetiella sp.]|jgi:ComEC/Rec2-related protein